MIASHCDSDLVVASDDNDSNASHATLFDGVDDFFARWIQHSDQTNKCAVRLQQIKRYCYCQTPSLSLIHI